MAERIVVIGGGEHARVVIDALQSESERFEVVGFVDPEPCAETAALMEVKRLGGDEAIAELARAGCVFVLGVGGVGPQDLRAAIVERHAGLRFATVVHARAVVSPRARVEAGALVCAGAIVNPGAHVGAHAVVNTGAVVEHDCRVGPLAHVGPSAALGGAVEVGARSYVGLGARVRDHVKIGRRVTVGMGSVVVEAVAEGAVVVGVPARRLPSDPEERT